MTFTDQARQSTPAASPLEGRPGEQQHESSQQGVNVGQNERTISLAAGSLLAAFGLSRASLPGLAIAAVGGGLIYRGVSGQCSLYKALGIDTAHEASGGQTTEEELATRGLHVAQTFLINKPAEELYRHWRNFENLPRIMSHLESVTILDDRRSHWVAKAPRLAGGTVEWDAEITRDEPSELIAWRSLPGADVPNAGQVRFAKALGDRGTEVHVTIDYDPPAGRIGKWIATLFGQNPDTQVREDLRNFKRMMEVGELPTVVGQPRGTCTGQGKRQTE